LRIAGYAVFMQTRQTRRRALRRAYARRVAEPPSGARLAPPRVDLPPREALPAELQASADTIRAEADAILAHRVDYLGSGPTDLGTDIDWHRDFKSGYRWPARFYMDLEVTRLDDDSDAKVPWELSRGHQLLTLARAAVLFRDERAAAELEAQLRSWLDANPVGQGINWVNAMEVGLRAANWAWAIGTLEQWRPLDPELRARVARSLQSHGRHVAANLEGSPFLRSNHYLSDLLGLLAIGAFLPDDRHARRWARRARRLFEREVVRQVHPDGVSFEASLPYHGLALEIFLLAIACAGRLGRPFSARFTDRVRRMLAVSAAVRHPGGRIPIFGDNDSGRVLPAGFDRPPTHDHLLWLGAALLGGPRPLEGPPHPEVAWTLGVAAWRRAGALAANGAPAGDQAFADGGLYVLDGGGTHVVVRCGDLGQNGNGGHAHNDLLSFELSRRGPVIVDSGNYAYTFDIAARNEGRSTRAHNAVMVDGQEINPIPAGYAFKLAQVAHPRVVASEPGVLVAEHDGYARLAGGVLHRRTFRLEHATGALTITDELRGRGTHDVAAHLHVARGARLAIDGARATITTAGGDEVAVVVDGAELTLDEFWVSDGYGQRAPAPVLVARRAGPLPIRLETRIG
jgi:uncharacterized heparinase superfamily protein